MDNQITNKIVKLEDIIHIAELTQNRCMYYIEGELQENHKKEEARQRDDFYRAKYIHGEVKYVLEFDRKQTVEKVNQIDWFIDSLREHTENITNVSIRFYANEEDHKESMTVDFTPNKIYYNSSNSNMSQNLFSQTIESYILNLPPRYDETIAKDGRRVTIPAISIAIPLALIITTICFILGKFEVLSSALTNILANKFVLLGMFVFILFLGSLIIPTKNSSLYRKIKIQTYYAGYDAKNYKSIHRNDYEEFKSKCEVCIGENTDMPTVRENIEKNYKKAKKLVFIENLISYAFLILLFLL